MNRLGIPVLMLLTIVLVRMCGSQGDFTADRHEATGTRALRDQVRARARHQGHGAGGTRGGFSAGPKSDNSFRAHDSNVRSGRGTPLSRRENKHTTATESGSPVTLRETDLSRQEGDTTLSLDSTLTVPKRRAANVSTQQMSRINTRQVPTSNAGNKAAAPFSRRLVGPNVCGGQLCCSGWTVAPGTNRCIKPDCMPPCQNRGSCSRPHTCVCRSGFQGDRCQETAPEQVYVRTGSSRTLRPVQQQQQQQQQQQHSWPEDPKAADGRAQTPKPQAPATATQSRRGPAETSPQQTGTSRTVKRYPSSNGPITSNALPSGSRLVKSHSGHSAVSQGAEHLNNAVAPIRGANLTSSLDRIKIVFTPMVCRRVCTGGRCFNSCEKGDTTTIYSENQNQNQNQPARPPGFRLFFCQIPCMNGGRCVGRDQCWCPSNSTGKFCHLPAPPPEKPPVAVGNRRNSTFHSMYTLPLSNQQASLHPSLVNVHVQHPPEAEVQIHQVARVKPGQAPLGGQDADTDGGHSVQQRSQPGNHGNGNAVGNGNGRGHAKPHLRPNGYVGRCFQETIDGQCGKPLPGLTKQDDCCGSVGASWGLNKCMECPPKPAYAVIANGQVECPRGYKRMNLTHCQDINECQMPGICKNAECLNTRGSYRCTCKTGYMLDTARSHCVSDKAISDSKAFCYRSGSGGSCSLPLSQHITKQICCCSRVGKAWGPACERCPLPDTDHFREICPAGHGYTYSRSDVQISLRQVDQDELSRTGTSQRPDPRTQLPPEPRYPTPDRRPSWELEDVETLRPPAVVTQSPSRFPADVVEKATPHSPINLGPESEGQDTAPINVATQVTDVDRCSVLAGVCGPGQCVSVQTGYTCYCDTGYKLNALQTRCVDVNECERDPCEGKGHCVNSFGSYSCHCHSGYSQVITQDRKFCQDVNECDMPNKCPGSLCINTEGSYTCECQSGYTVSRRGQCEDVNECRDQSACPTGRCVNTPGSFQCQDCNPGFRAAGGRCLDVNECLTAGACTHGSCVNLEGSHRCSCHPGYQASPDRKSCLDVDECLDPAVCVLGRCVNLEGSYRCSCNPGYQASPDGKSCHDINECATRNVCPSGTCMNTEGSYSCTSCQPGFVRSADGQRCEDVDECAEVSTCLGGVCANTEGSFTCTQCKSGFRLSQDRQWCEDINECLTNSVCPNGICLNKEGSYSCVDCPAGYRTSADGELCEDIDECTSPSACPTGTCTNTEGSYTCSICGQGYRLMEAGLQCEDVDECAQQGVCPDQACRNTAGSFSCVACGTGYAVSAQGDRCEDVDECSATDACPGQLCRNSPGSFSCSSCRAGFELSQDASTCQDVDECRSPDACPTGVCTNGEGSFSCMACDEGYRLSSDRSTCEDVDECEENRLCLRGECLNTPGSYSCSCPAGFELVDDAYCQDVNECLSPNTCGNGNCVNTEGSYACQCSPGYAVLLDWIGCQDVDECSEADVCSRGRCYNTDGSFQCLCEAGFTFSPTTADCEDKDECKDFGSSVCGTWRCENTVGSYRCFMGCQPGLEDEGMGSCDEDECASNETICGEHGFCENTDGSYRCQCDQGYTNPSRVPGCVDINECEMSTALCGSALCENVEGSFLCICSSDNEEFDPISSQCRSRTLMMERERAPPFSSSAPSDGQERKECYYNLDDAHFCDNALSRNATKQECCCTVGASWGDNCEIHPCPLPGRAEYNQLCPHGNGLLPLTVPSQGFPQQLFKDLDECEMFGSEICKNGQCSNTYSSYSCFCPVGFYYHTVRLECVDHDECQTEDTCGGSMCVNTPGSFICFCSPPLILDSTGRRCVNVNVTEEIQAPFSHICWQTLTSDNMCVQPLLSHRTTYTECCCVSGVAWGDQCAFCPRRTSEEYAQLCNLPRRLSEGTDSLRERPGYEYGPDGPDGPLYWGGYGSTGGRSYYGNSEYSPRGDPPFNSLDPDDYGSQEVVREPVHRPREFRPRLVNPYSDRYDGFEGLRAEECGILNGCENGRCVRVREGYTCDCFDGFQLDLTKMACIDINECEDISDKVPLCRNGACSNTDGSYKCTCLPGFLATAKPHECFPGDSELAQSEAGK